MSLKETAYTDQLTGLDRIKVKFIKDRRIILKFGVTYQALIQSRWQTVSSFDSHPFPHRHVYSPDKEKYKHPMRTRDNNQALTEATSFIKKNFRQLKEMYILTLRSRGGGK